MESELFGHERGAFTGATERRKGRFEQARGGTLFLDEIGELRPGLQPRLLRVLQDSVVERVGGFVAVKADVRVLAATHRDLRQLVSEGRLREDLFHRKLKELDAPRGRPAAGQAPCPGGSTCRDAWW